MNTLFNNVLGENEKCVFYFYLKTKGTSWPTQCFKHPCDSDTGLSFGSSGLKEAQGFEWRSWFCSRLGDKFLSFLYNSEQATVLWA